MDGGGRKIQKARDGFPRVNRSLSAATQREEEREEEEGGRNSGGR